MKEQVPNTTYRFLAGGGEMGQLIGSVDWAKNPLGPIENWPQSLRTTLSIILHSRFPMFLFWGRDLICFYNDAYRPSLGNNGKHPMALGQRGEEIWPEIWSDIKPLIDQVMSGGESSWSEDQLLPIYRNGTLEDVYWTFSYSPAHDESGEVGGVFVTCCETTEKVVTLKSIAESKDQFQFAIEAAELGTWDLNPATNRFTGNDRLKAWFGLAPEKEIDLPLALSIIADKDRQRVTEAIETALQLSSGGYYDVEYTLISPTENRERIVKAKGRAFFDENGIARRFNGTLQDITEEVRAREKQQKLLTLVENSVDLMSVLEMDGRNSYINKAGKELLGIDHDQEVSLIPISDLHTPEQFKFVSSEIIPSVMQFGRWSGRFEARNVKTGAILPLYNNCLRIDDPSTGLPMAVGAVMRDLRPEIAIQKALEESKERYRLLADELEQMVQQRTRELHESNQVLIKTNHELEQFAYIASHDLQEPLRKIQSFSELLQLNQDDDETKAQYLHKITTSAQRMADLIKAVLNYSRLSNTADRFVKTDLRQVLEHVETDFELLIEQKQATIRQRGLPVIDAIPMHLNQLFSNLIGNSLKFSTNRPVIDIDAEEVLPSEINRIRGLNKDLPYIHIRFKDNGIGFEPEYAERVFTIFQRLNHSRSFTGTGIGLALCRKIVESHGGIITAESELNQGATFHVYLPIRH
ncbi:PAS domain-containing sensor histidine kinase [Larkinella rosea]|uniref:histidine kinase n=1 Tax=Larkinella rosea TaxID=2025312 RepID=A0A3P1C1H2_9BACT|nr:PAS domain-containing sensor histidine kinase [Larkinella rosea]RRB07270.1 PAS domain-containing sensor histidine kinase [Larkinella rosea]